MRGIIKMPTTVVLSFLANRCIADPVVILRYTAIMMKSDRGLTPQETATIYANHILKCKPALLDIDPDMAGRSQKSVSAWVKRQIKMYGDIIDIPVAVSDEYIEEPGNMGNSDSVYDDGYPKSEFDTGNNGYDDEDGDSLSNT